MLFDPKWDAKLDPLSLGSLIAWLELQPADQEYPFLDEQNCLLGQYFFAKLGENGIDYSERAPLAPRKSALGIFYEIALNKGDYTFGAALSYARSLNAN